MSKYFENFQLSFCYLFLAEFHYGLKADVGFPSFKCVKVWFMAQNVVCLDVCVSLRRMYILLLLDKVVYRCL